MDPQLYDYYPAETGLEIQGVWRDGVWQANPAVSGLTVRPITTTDVGPAPTTYGLGSLGPVQSATTAMIASGPFDWAGQITDILAGGPQKRERTAREERLEAEALLELERLRQSGGGTIGASGGGATAWLTAPSIGGLPRWGVGVAGIALAIGIYALARR